MEHLQNPDQRLTDLEIKASFAEDLLDELNRVVVRQQQEIDLLTREVRQLKQLEQERGADLAAPAGNDLPPHY